MKGLRSMNFEEIEIGCYLTKSEAEEVAMECNADVVKRLVRIGDMMENIHLVDMYVVYKIV
jgi:hypothetical protein